VIVGQHIGPSLAGRQQVTDVSVRQVAECLSGSCPTAGRAEFNTDHPWRPRCSGEKGPRTLDLRRNGAMSCRKPLKRSAPRITCRAPELDPVAKGLRFFRREPVDDLDGGRVPIARRGEEVNGCVDRRTGRIDVGIVRSAWMLNRPMACSVRGPSKPSIARASLRHRDSPGTSGAAGAGHLDGVRPRTLVGILARWLRAAASFARATISTARELVFGCPRTWRVASTSSTPCRPACSELVSPGMLFSVAGAK